MAPTYAACPKWRPPSPAYRDWEATLRAAEIAGQQWGVIGWGQLRACGVSSSAATRWRAGGRLHVIHRRVYALGHPSIPIEGRLVAALLFAGADAVLSHRTAAWWWRLLPDEPVQIEVEQYLAGALRPRRHRAPSAPTASRCATDVSPSPPSLARSSTYAATEPLNTLRCALAQADYHRVVNRSEIEAGLGHGRPGAPSCARRSGPTSRDWLALRSLLERVFLHVARPTTFRCRSSTSTSRLPRRRLWRHQRVVVELDGEGNHSTPAQIKRDRGRDLHLRAAGYVVLRYTWEQVNFEAPSVAADIRVARSASPAPSAGPGSR